MVCAAWRGHWGLSQPPGIFLRVTGELLVLIVGTRRWFSKRCVLFYL